MEPEFPLQLSKVQNSSKQPFILYFFLEKHEARDRTIGCTCFFANCESEVILGVLWSQNFHCNFLKFRILRNDDSLCTFSLEKHEVRVRTIGCIIFFANRESEVFLGVMWSLSVQSYFIESVPHPRALTMWLR